VQEKLRQTELGRRAEWKKFRKTKQSTTLKNPREGEKEREIRTTAKKELAGGKPTIATPPAPPL